jgi:hypothetical protein
MTGDAKAADGGSFTTDKEKPFSSSVTIYPAKMTVSAGGAADPLPRRSLGRKPSPVGSRPADHGNGKGCIWAAL